VEEQLEQLLIAETAAPMDLAQNLPIRATLYRLNVDRHVLLLVFHHIAMDRWSMGLFWKDLTKAYAMRRQRVAPQWPSLPVQYADYALWQRAVLGEEGDPTSELRRQVGFWQEHLAALPAQLELPTDCDRPAVASVAGDRVLVRVRAADH